MIADFLNLSLKLSLACSFPLSYGAFIMVCQYMHRYTRIVHNSLPDRASNLFAFTQVVHHNIIVL